MYKIGFAAALAVLTSACPAALAQKSDVMYGASAGLTITIDGRGKAPLFPPRTQEYGYQGNTPASYNYALVRVGDQYEIVVDNKHMNDRMLCIAVDGRNILTGTKVTDATSASAWGGCYVVKAYSAHRAHGFRRSSGERGKEDRFVVARAAQSAAAVVHQDITATGTIVVALFEERGAPQWRGGEPRAAAPTERGALGTAAGESVSSPTVSVEFTPQRQAAHVFVLAYATRDRLVKLGVMRPASEDGFKRFGPNSDCGGYYNKKC